jgi:hypothetical protein
MARDAAIVTLSLLGFMWLLAMVIGLVAGAPDRGRRDVRSRVVRFCRAVALLSP